MRRDFDGYPMKDKKGRWYIGGDYDLNFEAKEIEFHGFDFKWLTKKNLKISKLYKA